MENGTYSRLLTAQMMPTRSQPQNEGEDVREDLCTPEGVNGLTRAKSTKGDEMNRTEQETGSRPSSGVFKAARRIMSDQKQYLLICVVLLICYVIGGRISLNQI